MRKLALVLMAIIFLVGCGGSGEKIQTLDLMNGSGTQSIGTVTQVIVPQSKVTNDYIQTWYNQIKDKGTNYDLIIYEQSINGRVARGVYHMGNGIVYKGVDLEKTSDGTYSISNMDTAIEVKVK